MKMRRMKMPDTTGMREKKYVERTTGTKEFLQSAESGAMMGRNQAIHKKPHAHLGSKGMVKVPHTSVKPKGAP